MEIVMAVQISGTRNGKEWPAIGHVIDLPDTEAHDLIRSGMAREVETAAVEPSVEVAAETAKPRTRKP